MKVTGFKLLKDGKAGMEVEGIDFVDSGINKVLFKDGFKRTRHFPLSLDLRTAVNVLKYPFLVGTEHWQGFFGPYMREDYLRPDHRQEYVDNPAYLQLKNMWDATSIQRCTIEGGSYKITGELRCDMCLVKATVVVNADDDHSLYSFVQEALVVIMNMIDQTLNVPQMAIGGGAAIRGIIQEMHGQEIPDGMSDQDAFIVMMRTAQSKGMGIVLDDNSLAQLAAGIEDEDLTQEVQQMPEEKQEMDNRKIYEIPAEDEAEVVSETTKDESIFKQEPSEDDLI